MTSDRLAEYSDVDWDGVELSIATPPDIPKNFIATIGITTPAGGFVHRYLDGGVTVVFGVSDTAQLRRLIAFLQTIEQAADAQ